jgi:hypothetical protein
VERRREKGGSRKPRQQLRLTSRNLPVVVMIRRRAVNLCKRHLVVEAQVVRAPQRTCPLDLNHSNRRPADQGEEEGRGRVGVALGRGEVQEETRVSPRSLVVWGRRKQHQPTPLQLNNLLIKIRCVGSYTIAGGVGGCKFSDRNHL